MLKAIAFVLILGAPDADAEYMTAAGRLVAGTNVLKFTSIQPNIDGTFGTFGFGGSYIRNRFVVDVEADLFFSDQASGASFFANLGFVVWDGGNFALYPLLGNGGGGAAGRAPPGEEAPSVGAYLLQAALAFDWEPRREIELGRVGYRFGLRLGYIFTPAPGDGSLNGPYLHLVIGGGITDSGLGSCGGGSGGRSR